MGYTQAQMETETHICWDRTGEPARLETFDAAVARRWERAGVGVLPRGEGRWVARVPVGDLRVGVKRRVSPEQREAMGARLQKGTG